MTMDPNRLWAKSKRDDEPENPSMFLLGHLQDVVASAKPILDATAADQLIALGLDPKLFRDRFVRCVLLATALHDIGKANDHFVGMICGARNVRMHPQGIRHEWVSILLLDDLRDWLLPAVQDDRTDLSLVEWAIAGHHPSPGHASPPIAAPNGSGVDIEIRCGHLEFAEILQWLKVEFCLPRDTPRLANAKWSLATNGGVFEEIQKWDRNARRLWNGLSTKDRRLAAAVKNAVVAADIAGSALPRRLPDNDNRWNWIRECLTSARPNVGDLDSIVKRRLGESQPRQFQSEVAAAGQSVTFVKAGCGSGKTLAAYMWAAANHPTRRLYFCYPTTGTATEGFKDYLFEPDGNLGDLGARLFHSRRDVDFEIVLTTADDIVGSVADTVFRIDALESWSTPIVACTVDAVLGLMQNNKRGLFAWPALSHSAFVFDEIHAFDDCLFGALLRFLRDLPGLPVLLMTASLSDARLAALKEVTAMHGIDLAPISGPPELESLPRYHKAGIVTENPVNAVRDAVRCNEKVLWVCNTVARVMQAAEQLRELNPAIYHSRFKYEDRVRRHKQVIDAFGTNGPALAVCSQVAEMSLDLSACLLVTDLATVPALIQRLGRLNRRAREHDPTSPFIVVEPGSALPYASAELQTARDWLSRLPDHDISQAQLAAAWEQQNDVVPSVGPSAWLDGGPSTKVRELREPSLGMTALMEDDVARVRSRARDLARLVIPMPSPPREWNWQQWRRERGVPVAPRGSVVYDSLKGAQWQK